MLGIKFHTSAKYAIINLFICFFFFFQVFKQYMARKFIGLFIFLALCKIVNMDLIRIIFFTQNCLD